MNDFIQLAVHGGDIDAVAAAYGLDASSLLDFSANVNPLGPPGCLLQSLRDAVADVDSLQRYPEPTYRRLREALARLHDLDPTCIAVANGASGLLAAAFATFDVRRALVPTPAFSEYRRALDARRAQFVAAPLDPGNAYHIDAAELTRVARAAGADTVVLNTPHNPSGTLIARDDVRSIAQDLARDDRHTIVDEAFVDYVPENSVIACAMSEPAMIVVRSLTKFFAVPSLRVGYAIAAPQIASRLRTHLESWPVTTFAARALTNALADTAYAERTRAANVVARETLRAHLSSRGFATTAAHANFVLVTLPQPAHAAWVVPQLIRDHGIVVRDCRSYEGFENGRHIRVAVRSPEDNARLIAALGAVCAAGERTPRAQT